jgi:hypothetical protein
VKLSKDPKVFIKDVSVEGLKLHPFSLYHHESAGGFTQIHSDLSQLIG